MTARGPGASIWPALVLAAVAIGCAGWIRARPSSPEPRADPITAAQLPRVRRVALDDRPLEMALRALASDPDARPTILSGAASIIPRWTPDTLVRHVPMLHRVYVAGAAAAEPRDARPDPSRFGPYFDESRPLSDRVSPRHAYRSVDVATSAFFGKSDVYHYYSAEVERDVPPLLLDELAPLESALVAHFPEHSSVNLWLATEGAMAPCHYDGYHNAFVQLHGAKTAVLLPPTASRLVQPFPFLHPSHAQCQAVLGEIAPHEMRLAGAVTAQLDVGDVLYLPPLWYHETTAHTTTIAVNGWTDCAEARAAAELFRVPRTSIPAAAGAGAPQLAATAAAIAALSASALGDARALFAAVWDERYAPLVASGELGTVSEPVEGQRLCDPVDVAVAARGYAAQVGRLARESLPHASRATWLANLAELVVAERHGVDAAPATWKALRHACA